VMLCDKESGCLLDEAETVLSIVYPDKPAVDVWTVLRKTTEVTVNVGQYSDFSTQVKPSSHISFKQTQKIEAPDWDHLYEEDADIDFQISADGKSITSLEIETISYYIGNIDGSKKVPRKLSSGFRYKYKNLMLKIVQDETSTKSARVSYYQDFSGTVQQAYEQEGRLVWGRVGKAIHEQLGSVHFSMSSEVTSRKMDQIEKNHKEKAQEEKKVVDASLGGLVYEGPFATETPFKAKIIIHVGKDGRTISGTFNGQADIKKGKSKMVLDGEFTGSLVGNGHFEALVSSSTMTPFKKTAGKWWPYVLDAKRFPPGSKLIGELQGNKITGDMQIEKKRAFKWSAELKE